jgi:hypothetical protein
MNVIERAKRMPMVSLLVLLILLVILYVCVSVAQGRKLVKVTCASGSTITLDGKDRLLGASGSYVTNPVLLLNDKVVHEGGKESEIVNGIQISGFYPRLPQYTQNLAFNTYVPEDSTVRSADAINEAVKQSQYWNVYVDPARFTQSEFNDLVSCYEENKKVFDTAETKAAKWDLIQAIGYSGSQSVLISSIVYAKELVPETYACEGGIELHINPDASWVVTNPQVLGEKENDIARFGSIGFSKNDVTEKQEFLPSVVDKGGVKEPDFLRSCTRTSDKKRLDSIYDYKIVGKTATTTP